LNVLQNQPKSLTKILLVEVLISALLGALPLTITVISKPNSSVVTYLSTLNPGDPVLIYLLGLFVLHLLVVAMNRYWLKPNQFLERGFQSTHEFTYQIGFTLHGVYRVVFGAVVAAVWILIEKNGTKGSFKLVLLSMILAFAALSSLAAFYLGWQRKHDLSGLIFHLFSWLGAGSINVAWLVVPITSIDVI